MIEERFPKCKVPSRLISIRSMITVPSLYKLSLAIQQTRTEAQNVGQPRLSQAQLNLNKHRLDCGHRKESRGGNRS
jgi:hypothetical protein